MHASSGTGRHPVRTGTDVRIRGRAMATDVGVAARVDAVRADTDGHRGVHAVGLPPAASLLAAALAGLLAAAVLLSAAIVRSEHAATRESRRESPGRERNLNRLRDDLLVHSVPPFCFAGRTIPPDDAQYELFYFRCLLEKQRKWDSTTETPPAQEAVFTTSYATPSPNTKEMSNRLFDTQRNFAYLLKFNSRLSCIHLRWLIFLYLIYQSHISFELSFQVVIII